MGGVGRLWGYIKKFQAPDGLMVEEKLLRKKCRPLYQVNQFIHLLALTLTEVSCHCNIMKMP